MPYLKGIWRFKDRLSTDGWGNFANKTDYVTFSSNGENFEFFANFNYDEDSENYWYLRYGTRDVFLFRHWSNATQSEVATNVWLNENYKTVNFGTDEKYVSDNFYLWFTANANLVDDVVPITTNLTNVVARTSNATTVAINGSVTLVFDALKGYKFPDSFSLSTLIVVGANYSVRVIDNVLYLTITDVTGNVDISIRTFTYDTSLVSMVLYQNSAEKNRVDKSGFINEVGFLVGTFRNEVEITSPTITLEYSTLPDFNYVYMPIFSRYYYVNSITSINRNLWYVSLSCDVLMTYKDKIRAVKAQIERQEFAYNNNMIDTLLPATNDPIKTAIEFPVSTDDLGLGVYVLNIVSKSEVVT